MSAGLEQIAEELHKPYRKNFLRRKVYTGAVDNIWAADLVDMSGWKKYNDDYKMMLTVIDGTSKYAWAIPLKGKTGKEVTDAFKRILDESKRSPNKLWVDQGKEFYNKDFQALMDSKGITMYSTQSGLKSVFAERFNKTLKTKMYKSFTSTGTRRWVDILDDLLNW